METHPISSAIDVPRLTFTIAESEVASGLSRATIYRLIAAGKLRTVQHGRRTLIPRTELERLCEPTTEASW